MAANGHRKDGMGSVGQLDGAGTHGRRTTASAVAGPWASSALYAAASVGGLERRGGSARAGNITSSTPARNASLAARYAATQARQVFRNASAAGKLDEKQSGFGPRFGFAGRSS